MAHPTLTEPLNVKDTIIVSRNQLEGEKEADSFTPRNTLPRSPPQPAATPTTPPEQGATTPPTKYSTPEDISRAPKKKDAKLVIHPDQLSTLRLAQANRPPKQTHPPTKLM